MVRRERLPQTHRVLHIHVRLFHLTGSQRERKDGVGRKVLRSFLYVGQSPYSVCSFPSNLQEGHILRSPHFRQESFFFNLQRERKWSFARSPIHCVGHRCFDQWPETFLCSWLLVLTSGVPWSAETAPKKETHPSQNSASQAPPWHSGVALWHYTGRLTQCTQAMESDGEHQDICLLGNAVHWSSFANEWPFSHIFCAFSSEMASVAVWF